mgnify:CR=1 FL=1
MGTATATITATAAAREWPHDAAAATAESDARNLSETRRLHCEAIQRPVNSMPLVLL